jgi:hypothetical protein
VAGSVKLFLALLVDKPDIVEKDLPGFVPFLNEHGTEEPPLSSTLERMIPGT